MTVNMESHVLPTNKVLLNKSAAEILIVSPPRSGATFAQANLRSRLEDSLESKILTTQYVSELVSDKNVLSIVRKPSDWIASWVADIVEFEPGRTIQDVMTREIAAAEVALQAYLDFESDKIVFVKFEDLVFKLKKTVDALAPFFGKTVSSEVGAIITIPSKTLIHNPTSTTLSHYPAVLEELANHDLSALEGLYNQLIAKTITI